MLHATSEEIAELLGDYVDEVIVARIVAVGASLDEIGEAIDDLEYELRYEEPRTASSARAELLRGILEELIASRAPTPEEREDLDDYYGLHIIVA